mmetsp:Transcript_86373/g.272558  ORF Transcript_86373/g.272558 Transcript_86373/m.272558 type:complete len:397 (+) Transcript_86373:44-1234(+)
MRQARDDCGDGVLVSLEGHLAQGGHRNKAGLFPAVLQEVCDQCNGGPVASPGHLAEREHCCGCHLRAGMQQLLLGRAYCDVVPPVCHPRQHSYSLSPYLRILVLKAGAHGFYGALAPSACNFRKSLKGSTSHVRAVMLKIGDEASDGALVAGFRNLGDLRHCRLPHIPIFMLHEGGELLQDQVLALLRQFRQGLHRQRPDLLAWILEARANRIDDRWVPLARHPRQALQHRAPDLGVDAVQTGDQRRGGRWIAVVRHPLERLQRRGPDLRGAVPEAGGDAGDDLGGTPSHQALQHRHGRDAYLPLVVLLVGAADALLPGLQQRCHSSDGLRVIPLRHLRQRHDSGLPHLDVLIVEALGHRCDAGFTPPLAKLGEDLDRSEPHVRTPSGQVLVNLVH